MNGFDLTVLHFVNSFAGHSHLADAIIAHMSEDLLLNGGFVMALFWWAWMNSDGSSHPEKREILIFGLVGSVFSLFIARGLALSMPFRERPLANSQAGVTIPYGFNHSDLMDWSSFPSDHATLFFCLAVTLWMISRRLGVIAICHAVFFVSLPRIYAGVHYPTDILAGAALGGGFAFLATDKHLRSLIATPALKCLHLYPAAFYTVFFLWTFEIAEMFNTVRGFLHPGLHVIEAVFHTFHTLALWTRV
jgi:undecaprenyl-diphosphatase